MAFKTRKFFLACLSILLVASLSEAGEVAEALPTIQQINTNLSEARLRRCDLIHQALNDNSLTFGDLAESVHIFEKAILAKGISQEELSKKRKAFSLAVRNAAVLAATEKLVADAKRDFLFADGDFNAQHISFLSDTPEVIRAYRYAQARFPTTDFSKVALLKVYWSGKSEKEEVAEPAYSIADGEYPLFVEPTVTFGERVLKEKVRVPVQKIGATQAIFLEQTFGTKQILRFSASWFNNSENNLLAELKVLYALSRLKQKAEGIYEVAQYPLGDAASRAAFKKHIKEIVHKQDWEPKIRNMRDSFFIIANKMMGRELGLAATVNGIFNSGFERHFKKLVTDESIQSYSEVISFLRGLRFAREDILTAIEKIRPSQKDYPFPSMKKEFYGTLVDG